MLRESLYMRSRIYNMNYSKINDGMNMYIISMYNISSFKNFHNNNNNNNNNSDNNNSCNNSINHN